ncbi:MAG: hypothetical protein WCI57_04335 [Candidatus Berkelbacteria bacterium]
MGEGYSYVPDGVAPKEEDVTPSADQPDTTVEAVPQEEAPQQIDRAKVPDPELWAQLESQAESIIYQIQEKILHHDYSFIIGDDSSGRLPVLLFSRLLANIYEKDGIKKPETRFLAGSRDLIGREAEDKKKLIENYLREQVLPEVAARKGKVLIVTDTIYSGKSLMPLVNALNSLRIPCEVVTLQFVPGYAPKSTMEANLGAHIYAGEDNDDDPEIYGRNDLSGVYKLANRLHANSNKSDTKVLGEARQRTAAIADKLTERLESLPRKKPSVFDVFKR